MSEPAVTSLTPEQVEARKGHYTSTRVVGLYQGRLWDVYNEMLGLALEQEDNPRMKAGRKLQNAIIEWAAEDRAWWKVDLAPGTISSETEPLFASSPDAIAWMTDTDDSRHDLVVEAKNRAGSRAREYEDGPLETDLVQLQWHMGVTGIHRGALVALLGGNDLRHGGNDQRFDLEFDAEMFAMLSDLALRFHREHVEPRIPPPMDASPAADAWIKATWPKQRTPLIPDDGRLAPLAVELRDAKAALEGAKNRELLARHIMQAALGDAEGAEGPWGRVLWRWQKGWTSEVTHKPGRVLRTYFTEED